ncbi:MAG: nitroreductase family protein [Planctomycetota bacterium]|nr:nitroreductase family protein [Planctomycetota bacterium]
MPTDPDPILAHLAAHTSVRRFTTDELPTVDLERAVAAAQKASTSSHVQAYSVLRVTDTAERARLAELCGGQRQVAEAGAFLVISGEVRRHRLAADRQGQPLARNLESFLLTVIDASLFAQNLAVALEALGYGVCFIGGLRTNIEAVDELLELPDDVFPLFGLCAGVPAELPDGHPAKPVPRPRLPVHGVLFEARLPDDATTLAAMDEHDAVMEAHYAARGKAGHTWTGGLVRRNSRPMREQLAGYYRSKGAVLD